MNVNMARLTTSIVIAELELELIVKEFRPEGSYFKVGISVNPARRVMAVTPTFLEPGGKPKSVGKMNPTYRWKDNPQIRRSVTTLYYLYQTPSYSACQNAERALIERLEHVAEDAYIVNSRAGGAGRIPRHGPYYVYLART